MDLIIDRPGMSTVVVEIKSSTRIRPEDAVVAARLGKDIPGSQIMVLSRDKDAKQYEAVKCMHWSEGLTEIFEARS